MGDGMSELNFKPTYKCRFPIIFFAWLALFFRFFHSSVYFVSFWDDGPHFSLPSGMSIFYWFTYLSMYALLAIYVTWFHKTGKATFVLQILFFLYATISLFSAIENIYYGIGGDYFSDVIFYILFDITISALFTVLALSSFKGSFNKVITILIFSVIVIDILVAIVNTIRSIEWYNTFYLFGDIVFILSYTFFSLTLFLFCMTNKIRPIVAPSAQSNQPADFNSLPPEQALVVLNNSFQSGQISFEQYKATREEILKKL